MRLICTALVAIFFAGCRSNTAGSKQTAVKLFEPDLKTSGPPALVYKTKADYSKLVPVMLSEDKTAIVSYPHPSDLVSGDSYQLPSGLKEGYLLDNRGIGKDVAFLKLSYQEYAALKQAPAPGELMAMILDRDPLVELCNCGNKAALTKPVEQLNTLIDSGKLRTSCLPVK
jgi:hypothetical protein